MDEVVFCVRANGPIQSGEWTPDARLPRLLSATADFCRCAELKWYLRGALHRLKRYSRDLVGSRRKQKKTCRKIYRTWPQHILKLSFPVDFPATQRFECWTHVHVLFSLWIWLTANRCGWSASRPGQQRQCPSCQPAAGMMRGC